MSEVPDSVSLKYMAGDDIEETWTVSRDDATVDLTNMTLRAVVARNIASDPVLSSEDDPATITLTKSNQTTNQGEFTWSWTGDASDDLSGTYLFEIEAEDASDKKSTVARGYITFETDIIP